MSSIVVLRSNYIKLYVQIYFFDEVFTAKNTIVKRIHSSLFAELNITAY